VELIPVTYELYDFTKDNWSSSDVGRDKVISEWNKIPVY